jgi:hypothetical protein
MLLLAILLVASAPLGGCKTKATLDKHVEGLRKSVEANDYSQVMTLCHPDLKRKVSKRMVAIAAKALAKLGPFKERAMRGIQVRAGGPSTGNYKLTYEKGVVRLRIRVYEGQIVGFRFHGEDFKRALRQVGR